MPTNIRVAVVDDHEIFRKAISDALIYENGFDVVFLAGNGVELLFELERNQVDVVILDLRMPVMSGKDALLIMNEKYPETKVIVLSMYDEYFVAIDMLQKGAHAYLSKDCGIEELIDAIHGVVNQGLYFTEKFPKEFMEQFIETSEIKYSARNSLLSERELDILRLICEEKCSREISESLNISERTVENHRYKISKKIGTSHGIGMLVYALQNGLAKITANGKVNFD
jgi:DNA-binding NarL/FixJ family response regulator